MNNTETHILIAAAAIRTASASLSLETGVFRLTWLPRRAAGITVSAIGMVISQVIWPVVALPINPAIDESKTIARLLPIAILVGI